MVTSLATPSFLIYPEPHANTATLGEERGATARLLSRSGIRWKFKSHFIKDDF